MRAWSLLILFSAIICVSLARPGRKSRDFDEESVLPQWLQKIVASCKRSWHSVKDFFSGKKSWNFEVFGRKFSLRFPKFPSKMSNIRRRSRKFENTLKGDAATRALFAIYLNVSIVLAVFSYIVVRQILLTLRQQAASVPLPSPKRPVPKTNHFTTNFSRTGTLKETNYAPVFVDAQQHEDNYMKDDRTIHFSDLTDDVVEEAVAATEHDNDVIHDVVETRRAPVDPGYSAVPMTSSMRSSLDPTYFEPKAVLAGAGNKPGSTSLNSLWSGSLVGEHQMDRPASDPLLLTAVEMSSNLPAEVFDNSVWKMTEKMDKE